MKCNEIQELMPDLAAGRETAKPEVSEHLATCKECAGKLNEFRQTMVLLDQWQTPEPSPYFDTRLQARLREEAGKQTASWWSWMRRPAMAAALALVAAFSLTVYRNQTTTVSTNGGTTIVANPGTAVGDLQALDNNSDLYANFDELDDLQVQQDVTANP